MVLKLLPFAVMAAALCSVSPLGRAHNIQKRVAGGQEYQKGEFPFHVSLWYGEGYNKSATWLTYMTPELMHYCGGVLVGNRWVLTAAFCVTDGYQVGARNMSLVKIAVGMHAQTDAKANAQFYTISDHFIAPDYDWDEGWGNLALIKLDRPVVTGQFVGLAILNDDPSCPSAGQAATVLGWGQAEQDTSLYGYGSDVPHKTDLEVVDFDTCNETYLGWLAEGQMCAGTNDKKTKGGCWGDYGSPLLVSSSCGLGSSPVVAGIYSYSLGCGRPGEPGVYTEVRHYKSWIDQTISANG